MSGAANFTITPSAGVIICAHPRNVILAYAGIPFLRTLPESARKWGSRLRGNDVAKIKLNNGISVSDIVCGSAR